MLNADTQRNGWQCVWQPDKIVSASRQIVDCRSTISYFISFHSIPFPFYCRCFLFIRLHLLVCRLLLLCTCDCCLLLLLFILQFSLFSVIVITIIKVKWWKEKRNYSHTQKIDNESHVFRQAHQVSNFTDSLNSVKLNILTVLMTKFKYRGNARNDKISPQETNKFEN